MRQRTSSTDRSILTLTVLGGAGTGFVLPIDFVGDHVGVFGFYANAVERLAATRPRKASLVTRSFHLMACRSADVPLSLSVKPTHTLSIYLQTPPTAREALLTSRTVSHFGIRREIA